MPDIALEIVIGDKRWRRIPRLNARLQKAARAALGQLPPRFRFSCRATVLLTNDAAMKRLNRDFRGHNRPTNVLSFPQWEARELSKKGKKRGVVELGDIALGYQYMVGESKKHHKILINHVTHLLVHGILHLFGYDHLSGIDAVRMERLEQAIMAGLGLPDPYGPPRPGGPAAHKRKE